MLLAVKVGDSLQQGFDRFFGFLPNLLGFIVILVVGYIVAKIVKGIIGKVLEKVGLDKALHESQAGEYVEKVSPGASPSRAIGAIAFWFVFLGAISIAVAALGIAALTDFVATIFAYLPNVVAAVLIFVAASVVAGAVGGLAHRTMGDTQTGKVVRAGVPVLVMGIATFMILNQLKIAPQIVTITYAALLGSVALGMALAFGLGGREVAGRLLEDAYGKGEEKKDQVKDELETGKERAKDQAQEAKEKAQDKAEEKTQPQDGGGPTQLGAAARAGGTA